MKYLLFIFRFLFFLSMPITFLPLFVANAMGEYWQEIIMYDWDELRKVNKLNKEQK